MSMYPQSSSPYQKVPSTPRLDVRYKFLMSPSGIVPQQQNLYSSPVPTYNSQEYADRDVPYFLSDPIQSHSQESNDVPLLSEDAAIGGIIEQVVPVASTSSTRTLAYEVQIPFTADLWTTETPRMNELHFTEETESPMLQTSLGSSQTLSINNTLCSSPISQNCEEIDIEKSQESVRNIANRSDQDIPEVTWNNRVVNYTCNSHIQEYNTESSFVETVNIPTNCLRKNTIPTITTQTIPVSETLRDVQPALTIPETAGTSSSISTINYSKSKEAKLFLHANSSTPDRTSSGVIKGQTVTSMHVISMSGSTLSQPQKINSMPKEEKLPVCKSEQSSIQTPQIRRANMNTPITTRCNIRHTPRRDSFRLVNTPLTSRYRPNIRHTPTRASFRSDKTPSQRFELFDMQTPRRLNVLRERQSTPFFGTNSPIIVSKLDIFKTNDIFG